MTWSSIDMSCPPRQVVIFLRTLFGLRRGAVQAVQIASTGDADALAACGQRAALGSAAEALAARPATQARCALPEAACKLRAALHSCCYTIMNICNCPLNSKMGLLPSRIPSIVGFKARMAVCHCASMKLGFRCDMALRFLIVHNVDIKRLSERSYRLAQV